MRAGSNLKCFNCVTAFLFLLQHAQLTILNLDFVLKMKAVIVTLFDICIIFFITSERLKF